MTIVAPRPQAQQPPVPIPAILLEGDERVPEFLPVIQEPELQTIAIAPKPVIEPEPPTAPASTPESLWEDRSFAPAEAAVAEVGESTLSLLVRDPHSLVAHWNLTKAHADLVRDSAGRHLVLRIFEEAHPGRLLVQMYLPVDQRVHQVNVSSPGGPYTAELGVFDGSGEWLSLASSSKVRTPSGVPAPEPRRPEPTPEASFPEVVGLPPDPVHDESIGRAATQESTAVAAAVAPVVEPLPPNLPDATGTEVRETVPALQETIIATRSLEPRADLCTRIHDEFVARPGGPASSESMLPDAVALGAEGHLPSVSHVDLPSSPQSMPDAGPGKPFWFRLDADLVVYGATEPGARLVVAGEPVELRPDGTFTLRFALPDGEFHIGARATSADGTATRGATLKVKRSTAKD